MHADYAQMVYGLSPVRAALLRLPYVGIVLLVALLAAGACEWAKSAGPRGQRVRHALFAATAVAFVPLLGYWNLLSA